MYAGVANKSVGIPFLGAQNSHCPEYPLMHEILVIIHNCVFNFTIDSGVQT